LQLNKLYYNVQAAPMSQLGSSLDPSFHIVVGRELKGKVASNGMKFMKILPLFM